MPKPSNYPTDNRTKRHEFWSTPEAAEVLEAVEAQGETKAAYINRAIVEYWALTNGEKIPILDEKTIKKLAKEVAAELKKIK